MPKTLASVVALVLTSACAQQAPEHSETGDVSKWSFDPTLTVDQLDQNNTSACGDANAPCSQAWTQTHTITYGSNSSAAGETKTVDGYWDNLVSSGTHDPSNAVGRISKVPVSELLQGYDVPVYVASQNWWGRGGHIDNGESSLSTAQAADQIDDMISRGFAGETVAWEGPGTFPDNVVKNLLAAAKNKNFKIGVRVESQYFASCGKTAACVTAAAKYVAENLATSSSAYLRDDKNNPVLYFFLGDEDEYTLPSNASVDSYGTTFVLLDEPHDTIANKVIGEFAWVAPTSAGDGFENLTQFYTAAKARPNAYNVGSVYKGFDDALATWYEDRVIDQKCGMTWLEMFDHTEDFAGSTSYLGAVNYLAEGGKLSALMVNTWDDYEEGTEIETGIDNCMTAFTTTLEDNTLSWAASWGTDPMNSAYTGSEATINHYAIYLAAKGGSKVMHLTDVQCTKTSCPSSIDVSTLGITGGPYVFYVEAVGQPSVVNHRAGPTAKTYTGD